MPLFLDGDGIASSPADASRPYVGVDPSGNVIFNVAPGKQVSTYQGGTTSVIIDNGTGGGGDQITPPVTITNTVAATVPLSIVGAAAQSGDLIDFTASGGAAGGLAAVQADGSMLIANGARFKCKRADGTAISIIGIGATSNIVSYNSGNTAGTCHQFFTSGGNTLLQLAGATSNFNGFQMLGSATGSPIALSAVGTDTNISLGILPKGTGILSLQDSNGTACLRVVGSGGTGANQITITGSTAGNPPLIAPTGTDGTIDMRVQPKGIGNFVALSGNGGGASQGFVVNSGGSITAANGVIITLTATGVAPSIAAQGSDTNVGLTLAPKGTSPITFSTSQSATALQLTTNGTNNFLTITGASTSGFVTGSSGFVRTANIQDPPNALTVVGITGVASAVNSIQLSNAATGSAPSIAAGGSGSDTNIDVNITPKGTGVINAANAGSAAAISGSVGPAALATTTGGATGPATATQNQWLKVKIAGTINYIPVWQ